MTFVVGLALVSLGFVFGVFTTASMCENVQIKTVANSGHIVIDTVLYKCIEVKKHD